MPGGRPPIYNDATAKQALNYCLLGATDAELAGFFGVAESTINNWKIEYPEFLDALKDGRDRADARVVKSLYQRAKGYSHKAVKIFLHEGQPVIVDYIERFPPETTAAIFWLKNRQKKRWRNKEDDSPEGSDAAVIIKGGLPD
jgi:hypothetical protein